MIHVAVEPRPRHQPANPHAVYIDVGIACAGGRMVAVARLHHAWASPTISAAPPGRLARSGHSCAMLGMGLTTGARRPPPVPTGAA